MALEKIGAYYQCHSNRAALNFVLLNYRRHYPDSTLVMVCDGGEDFSTEANSHNAIYVHDRKINTEKNLVFRDPPSLKRFVDRIAENIHHITEDYFMLLEDDVYVIRKIVSEMLWDINGCNMGEFFSDDISRIISQNNPAAPPRSFYGCFGGTVLRTEFFRRILSDKSLLQCQIDKFCEKCHSTDLASDKILSFICLMNGGTVGHYDGLCETWYADIEQKLERSEVEVLHKYKEHYN